MNEIYQKSKTCQKPAIEISVACQAGQGKPARQGRKNLPLAGLAGQVADPWWRAVWFTIRFCEPGSQFCEPGSQSDIFRRTSNTRRFLQITARSACTFADIRLSQINVIECFYSLIFKNL
jgi:hypothetical protein